MKTSVTCPAEVTPELDRRLRQLVAHAFRAIGGWGYGRVDIRLDENDEPYVLEVNCNPCITPGESGFISAAGVSGLTFDDVVHRIVADAVEQAEECPPPEKRSVIQ